MRTLLFPGIWGYTTEAEAIAYANDQINKGAKILHVASIPMLLGRYIVGGQAWLKTFIPDHQIIHTFASAERNPS